MKPQPCLIDDCSTCVQRPTAEVCNLAGEDLVAFGKIKRTIQYEPHQTVFYEGHACLGLYVLCAGKVKLTRSSIRGQRQIMRILDGGELIEKHVFRDGALHEVTCETLERSQICLIEKEPYLALIQRNPQLAIKLIQLLSNELGMHVDRLDQFTFKTARERLAGLLLELGERFGKTVGTGVLVGITFTREELAAMAGIAVETAIRLLSAFRKEGLIGLKGRSITVLRADRLARIAKL